MHWQAFKIRLETIIENVGSGCDDVLLLQLFISDCLGKNPLYKF